MIMTKPLVGVSYFSGWWRETPNKWQDAQHGFADWRGAYPERIPTHGCFNDQATMDADIINASAYGVDYFQILWYPVQNITEIDEPHVNHLDDGLRHFLRSKECGKMKFIVEYCNHPPFTLNTQSDWEAAYGVWREAFAHPSYLKVDGKLVFKIHSWDFLCQQCGSETNAVKKLEALRARVRDEFGAETLITAYVASEDPVILKRALEHIDFISTYMEIPPDEVSDKDYPYDRLFEYAANKAEKYGQAGIAYQPFFPSGWNPRPWHDPRPSYALPTKTQIYESVRKLIGIIDKYDCLGILSGGRMIVKAFTIYAWNEFGEGGFMAPSVKDGYEKLEGLSEALERD